MSPNTFGEHTAKQLSKKLALLLAVLVLVAAACSSDDDDSAADATDAGDSAAEETSSDDGGDDGTADEAGLEGTLRVMIHQNPPMVAWVENFATTSLRLRTPGSDRPLGNRRR